MFVDELAIAQKRIADLEAFIDKSITTKRLRDEFAMAAMNGLLSNAKLAAVIVKNGAEWIDASSYEYADAMMAEREKTK
jgi:hypothetical protein